MSTRLLRISAIVLASPFFFLASCTTGTWFIGEGLSHWQARKDPARYAQAVVVSSEGKLLYLSSMESVEQIEALLKDLDYHFSEGGIESSDAAYPYSFLLPLAEGRIEIDNLTYVRFEASPVSAGRQKITVSNVGDDYTKESEYYATRNGFALISSRIFGVGHVMGAIPYAFVLSLFFHGIGLLLKKRTFKPRESMPVVSD